MTEEENWWAKEKKKGNLRGPRKQMEWVPILGGRGGKWQNGVTPSPMFYSEVGQKRN